MFGIIRPCRNHLGERLRQVWMSHLCGLCLTLRDSTGQASRVATNVDGLVLSVLVAAQSAERTPTRTAGPCPLRGMRRAEVTDSSAAAARLAAAVSLTAAATKARDHVTDSDGLWGRPLAGRAARRLAGSAARAGARTGQGVGFDVAVLERAAERQFDLERGFVAGAGTPLLELTAPTEQAAAAAFSHTAALSGVPGNAEALAEAGRMFGRLVHLLDAVADQTTDDAAGAWNPLSATGTGRAKARAVCDDAHLALRLALADVEFTGDDNTRLARRLLVDELGRTIEGTFRTAERAENPDAPPRRRHGHTLPNCLAASFMCCTCQMCTDYTSPLDGQRKSGQCDRCSDCADCCDSCDCCDCCSCGDCCSC